jgi:hypothetical protein
MSQQLFSSQRERILKAYKDAGQTVIARTIPYHSTGVFKGTVVDADTTVSPGVAFLKFAKNQQVVFFSYGIGDQIDMGGPALERATDAETNLAKGTSTNGAQDYVIEGVGFHNRGLRVTYPTGAQPYSLVADAAVQSALRGGTPIYDPAAIIVPPQGQSPFNLENGIFQALLGQASLNFLFDQQRIEKIGTLDLLPQAGAQSYLRANGTPECSNRYRIPEGYMWRKDGMADCELTVTVTLQHDIVIPINRITGYHDAEGTGTWAPTDVALECVMRLYGLGVNMPSDN